MKRIIPKRIDTLMMNYYHSGGKEKVPKKEVPYTSMWDDLLLTAEIGGRLNTLFK